MQGVYSVSSRYWPGLRELTAAAIRSVSVRNCGQFVSGLYGVTGKAIPKWYRSALVEKDTHAAGSACLCCLDALCRVLENHLRLPAGYPGEPFQKLVEGCAAFQILE